MKSSNVKSTPSFHLHTVHMHVHMHKYTKHMQWMWVCLCHSEWRSEGNLRESVLFYCVGLGD